MRRLPLSCFSLQLPLLPLAALLWLAACGEVAAVEVTAPSSEVWAGQTLQLTAVVRDGAGQPLQGHAVTWLSEDSTVATVDAAGLVTGVTVGTTTLVATHEGKQGRLRLGVRSRARGLYVWSFDYPPHGRPYLPSLVVGHTLRLWSEAYDSTFARISMSAASTRWSTSDPAVATVAVDGANALVTAVAPGRVTVTATFEGVREDFPLVVGKGYTLTTIGPPSPFGVEVTNLNEHGHMVGRIGERAFLWQGGPVIDLGIAQSVAWDVNGLGQVVGTFTSQPGGGIIHPFSWQAGAVTDLAPDVREHTHAVAINDRGEVAGYTAARWIGGEPAHAVLWRNGEMNDLGTLGGSAAFALDISPQGDLVGFRTDSSVGDVPFLLRDGQLSLLPMQDGEGRAVAVSEDGAIAGNTEDTAFRWKDGTVTYLPPDHHMAIRVSDMNRHGQVVGHAEWRPDAPAGEPRAILWMDGVAVDLSGLVTEPGWSLWYARAINDRGQIAVETSKSSYRGPHGALLTPVP